MSNLLFLAHRLPYPPNKGDKVRSYHLLRHLRQHHNLFVGTFVDDPDDERHVDTLRAQCTELFARRLRPLRGKLRSLNALLSRDPLTLRYYRDARMYRWVEEVCKRNRIDAAVVFSSSMAQYVEGMTRLPMLVDFVDVDSEKWVQYAQSRHWPASWVYRREGERLLAYERAVAAKATRAFFVTEQEAALFRRRAPEVAVRVDTLGNGVDAEFFAPDPACENPYPDTARTLVFTGAMDYWPNVDAVTWFASECLPALQQKYPDLRFCVVGRNPAPDVTRLASDHVLVTGTVPDVRPYLQHASVIVAPLRVARGIQNKILEAMAMARPVVTSDACGAVIQAPAGEALLTAGEAAAYVDQISRLLDAPELAARVGQRARAAVFEHYSWDAQLAGIEDFLPRRTAGQGAY